MQTTSNMGDAESIGGKRHGVHFFHEADAPMLEETNVMQSEFSPPVQAGLARMVEQGFAEGYVLKCLFASPEPDGFSLTYIWFKGNYPLPPHQHNVDCLYYVIAGELLMGSR